VAKHLAVTSALIAALALSACGSSKKSASTSSTSSAATPASAQTTSKSGPYSSGTSSTSAASGSAGAAVTVSTKHAKGIGTILAAGKKHLTVYLFEADHGTTSTCTGACEQVWPPVKATGQVGTAGAAVGADLGTTTRADGTKQVTYKGHPLYYYAKDGDSGDAYGQGIKSFGADWYGLRPSGSKADTS
jgi:predicted lipoprotein with Yx(FWY)xxD motif